MVAISYPPSLHLRGSHQKPIQAEQASLQPSLSPSSKAVILVGDRSIQKLGAIQWRMIEAHNRFSLAQADFTKLCLECRLQANEEAVHQAEKELEELYDKKEANGKYLYIIDGAKSFTSYVGLIAAVSAGIAAATPVGYIFAAQAIISLATKSLQGTGILPSAFNSEGGKAEKRIVDAVSYSDTISATAQNTLLGIYYISQTPVETAGNMVRQFMGNSRIAGFLLPAYARVHSAASATMNAPIFNRLFGSVTHAFANTTIGVLDVNTARIVTECLSATISVTRGVVASYGDELSASTEKLQGLVGNANLEVEKIMDDIKNGHSKAASLLELITEMIKSQHDVHDAINSLV